MADGFLGLRHHAVVSGNDEDHNIGDLGAAGAHGGEGLVTGCVEEGDLAAVDRHLVGAGALGDTTRLARGDIGVADTIEQRGLAVVDMTKNGDDRRAILKLRYLLLGHDLLDTRARLGRFGRAGLLFAGLLPLRFLA